ncbi:uncharacterized protein LOC117178650 [Belonocnema kinseyi]|uniref:uncharacterized protein LOC117178650 n=1 Tax=Belonocnema kinseyi TaxID=2817044 RepID=UPI00143DB1C1|nr:uncharacterized protein LOC117178650 [Belonocnema kinseyi]
MHAEWIEFRDELDNLDQISVPRLILCNNPVKIELHGFCDVSEKAYGASIYVRAMDDQGNVRVNLLCSESRVAPLTNIYLPRLELCGALLLAGYFHKVITSLDMKFDYSIFWCGSTITLAWIKGPSYKWETYVSNRSTKIQELTKEGIWNHVSSSDNPADIISRGINPAGLLTSDLWWHGPAWLSRDPDNWPTPQTADLENVPEMKKNLTSSEVTVTKRDSGIFELFSSFMTFCRVLSWCFRISNNLARSTTDLKTGYLTPIEIESTKNSFIKKVQTEYFRTEIQALEQKREISNSSKLKSLQPFLDDSGLLRVDGSLRFAPISYDQKYKIILPADNILTRLIIMDKHSRFRVRPVGTEYIMGNLPAARVTPSRPFNSCEVDYAGPYLVKDRPRSKTITKAYLFIFVCFATKAVHLELAADLSTSGFLSCFHGVISRRGLPQDVYSVNGANFVGAKN